MAFQDRTLSATYLTLLIGPAPLPVAAPKSVTDALQSVQVTSSKNRSGFQLNFTVGKTSPLLQTTLPVGFFDPIITRVIVLVTMGGIQSVLMDGLVTNQELSPANEPGQSMLTITGEDLSIAMDLIELTISYPAMPEVVIINSILARYAFLGIIPLVIPPFISNLKNPLDKYFVQAGTDRSYIQMLAQTSGFVFFVQPGPAPGRSIAYFGPDINVPVPQAALSINFDAHSNAESMSFSLDGLAKQVKLFTIYDPITHKIPIPIPVPNINAFKPPLGLRLTPPAKFTYARDAASMTPSEAAQAILGFMMSGSNSAAISGNGSIDVTRYNQILRARMLVGVRGAGRAYDGTYYVDSVTHNIKKGEYKQSFTISRDGLISNTSAVRV